MYDVTTVIRQMDDETHQAVAVLGGAQFAIEYVHNDTMNIDEFVLCLPYVARNAKFFHWPEGPVDALNRFCHICLVDPKLIEAYLGVTFEEVVKHV